MNRFTPNNFGHLLPDQDGAWIRHSDVAALEREISDLKAAAVINERALIEATRKLTSIEPSAQSLGIDAVKVRDDALEEAALVCYRHSTNQQRSGAIELAEQSRQDAAAIREMKSQPLPSQPEPLGQAMSDEDICAFQETLKLLELIASGNTYSKDHDLDGAFVTATIHHAKKHAAFALKRFQPAYMRMVDIWRSSALLHKDGASGRDAKDAERLDWAMRYGAHLMYSGSGKRGHLYQIEYDLTEVVNAVERLVERKLGPFGATKIEAIDLAITQSLALSSQPSDDGRGKP